MHRPLSILAALALVASFATPALAANPSPMTATESLTITATTTLAGVPTTLSYGTALAGASVNTGTAFTITVTSNNGTGFNVFWAASDLTATGGTIAAPTNRSIVLTNAGGGTCATVGALSGYSTAPGKAYTGPAGTAQSFVVNTAAGTCAIAGVKLYLAIPGAAVAAAYTGTSTFSVTENP